MVLLIQGQRRYSDAGKLVAGFVYRRRVGRATNRPIQVFNNISSPDSLAEDVVDTPSRVKDPTQIVDIIPSKSGLMLSGQASTPDGEDPTIIVPVAIVGLLRLLLLLVSTHV